MALMLRSWFIFYLLTKCVSTFGQHPFVQIFTSEEYNAGQNLKIAQDNQNIIHITNSEGLLSYDGEEWDLHTIPEKIGAYAIAIDSADNIYVGSRGAIGYFQRNSKGDYVYHSLMSSFDKSHDQLGVVHDIIVHQESVFILDENHLHVYSQDTFQSHDIKTRLFNSNFISGKHLYILNENYELFEFKNNQLETVHNDRNIQILSITQYERNKSLVLDSNSNVWIFNPDAPLKSRWKLFSQLPKKQLGGEKLEEVKYVNENMIALFTKSNILFMNKSGAIISNVSSKYLNNYYYSDAFVDANQDLWVISPVNILRISTSLPLNYLDNHDGFKGQITSLAQKGDDQYIGTGWGIFHRKERSAFELIANTSPGQSWDFQTIKGQLFAAHDLGVFELNGDVATMIIEHSNVLSIQQLSYSPDTLIMGTYNSGLWRLTKSKGVWNKKHIKGFDEYTRFMQPDHYGSVWVSEVHKGVWKLELNNKKDSILTTTFYDKSKGLPTNINNRVHRFKRGKLVATTMNGVYAYNPAEDLFQPDVAINEALEKNTCIYSITEDLKGNLFFWGISPLGQETGGILNKEIDGGYTLEVALFGKIARFRRRNSIDVEAPLFITPNSELLMGNKQRLIIYDNQQKSNFDTPTNAYIKKITARKSVIYRNGQTDDTATLPYENNNLTFEFRNSFYESPEKTLFQYKLEGFDEHWSSWETSKTAVYTNLPEGDYKFMVRCKNIYERVTQPAHFSFHLQSPWYRTTWAYLFYLIIIGITLYLIIFTKTKRIAYRNRKLEKKVTQKTKELHLKNEEISNINKDINKKNQEIAKQAEELQKMNLTKDKMFSIISHDIRGSSVGQLPEMFRLLESGHLTKDDFQLLIPGIRERITSLSNMIENLLQWAKSQMNGIVVQKTRFKIIEVIEENALLGKTDAQEKNISVNIKTNADQVVLADKDMTRLILRNLISNAIKFTPENGEITISTLTKEESLYISVTDNGIGISEEEIQKILSQEFFSKYGTSGEKGSGLGLKVCMEFAQKNGGTLSIESTPGIGSKFTFDIQAC